MAIPCLMRNETLPRPVCHNPLHCLLFWHVKAPWQVRLQSLRPTVAFWEPRDPASRADKQAAPGALDWAKVDRRRDRFPTSILATGAAACRVVSIVNTLHMLFQPGRTPKRALV